MKKVTYSCNLCREEKKPEVLTCIYWSNTMVKPFKQAYMVAEKLDSSDMHICDDCVELVKTINK